MNNSTASKSFRVNTNNETDRFVGIKCVNNNISVNFPLGFRVSEDEKEKRKDIMLLLKTLANNTNIKESRYTRITDIFNEDEELEPIKSYMYIIQDYFDNGLYKEKEISYRQNNKGKIHWGRTIKTQKPYISNGSIFYLDLVTKKNSVKEDDLITRVHQYCVQKSFSKIWWLYVSKNPIKKPIKANTILFESVLIEKLNNTFNDNDRLLFEHMLAIIKHKSNDDHYDLKYGTSKFEYVWERMIDKAIGIKNKRDFFPNTQWVLNEQLHDNHSLMPDTIMLQDSDIYVVDAKYYKYGETKKASSLPGTADITKQIAYGEYIFKKKKPRNSNVYNIFVLPYDKSKYRGEKFEYCGYAMSDWKKGINDYEKIQAVLMDVKDLMVLNGRTSDKTKKELARLFNEKR